MRFLAILVALILGIGLASAQVPLPQTVIPPAVPSGLDASGLLTSRQLTQADVTPLPLESSTTYFQMTTGIIQFSMDGGNAGFAVGYSVQVTSRNDPGNWGVCIITALDVNGYTTCVTTIVNSGGYDNNWSVQALGGSTLNGLPIWAGLSVTNGFDAIPVPSAQGQIVNMTVEPGKAFAPAALVYVWAPQDQVASWFLANVIAYNPATGALQLFVSQTGNSGGVFAVYYVSMIDAAGPSPALIGFSSTPQAIGANTFTFVTQAGQFFPIDGQVLMTCTDVANPAAYMAGQVVAYQGTTLMVRVTANGVFGSGACGVWTLYLTTGPTTRIPYYAMHGLQVIDTGGTTFEVREGSVRDYTDNIDLVLPAPLTLDLANLATVVTASGAGTITSAGAAVTGSGSNFSSLFGIGSADSILNDFQLQYQAINGSFFTYFSTIGVSGKASAISGVTDNTNLTTYDNLGVTGVAYTRCGVVSHLNVNAYVSYFIVLARADADGSLAVFASCITPNGQPDLPAGYTYYRVLAAIDIAWFGSTYGFFIVQPLRTVPLWVQGDMLAFDSFQTFTRIPIGNLGDFLQVGNSLSGTGNIAVWGPPPLPVYNAAGSLLTSPHAVSDQATLSGGTKTVTLSGAAAFANANSYIVVATDATGVNAVKAANVSGSSFTLTGTGSDKVSFIAMSAFIVPVGGCSGTIDLSTGCAQGPLGGL